MITPAQHWIVRDKMPYAVLLIAYGKEGIAVLVNDEVWIVKDVFSTRAKVEQAIAAGLANTERFTLSKEGADANMKYHLEAADRLLEGFLEGFR